MSDVRTKQSIKEGFDLFLFEAEGAATANLYNSDREYREKSHRFYSIMEQLDNLAEGDDTVVLDGELKAALKELGSLYLDVTSASHTATYLQGYRDSYELFRLLGIIH